jgi:predicted GNAT family acetyltransferase
MELTVRRVEDPVEFRERALPLLMADEARHNIMISVSRQLVEDPGIYSSQTLWLVERDGATVLAAHFTPPFELALCRPAADGAIEALARFVAGGDVRPDGVSGALPEGEVFARAWSELTGDRAVRSMTQGIYRLESVREVPTPAGAMRAATTDDRALLIRWIDAFGGEVLPEFRDEPGRTERMIDRRLAQPEQSYFLWEHGEPVCLVGAAGLTPNGIRIAPVYTPPEHRGHGYATALTAAVSALQLERGRTFCFLYTDLSNPTSNAIYQRIGYEQVCEAAEYRFEPAAG